MGLVPRLLHSVNINDMGIMAVNISCQGVIQTFSKQNCLKISFIIKENVKNRILNHNSTS